MGGLWRGWEEGFWGGEDIGLGDGGHMGKRRQGDWGMVIKQGRHRRGARGEIDMYLNVRGEKEEGGWG